MSALEQLKKLSTVVVDTGDFEAIEAHKPIDATTNPSLVLNASIMDRYKQVVEAAVCRGKRINGTTDHQVCVAMDYLNVIYGCEILKHIPGRVSTEIDARLAFDTEHSVDKALKLISIYKSFNVPKERVLIKIPATWEGIKAAEILEKEHFIACNLTLIFSLVQAVASAEAGVTVISPFVGRIVDWHLANTDCKQMPPHGDPGVASVRQIYNYLKKFEYKTEVMAASFRSTTQIKGLAGCDMLTISPGFLEQLDTDRSEVPRQLSPAASGSEPIPRMCIYEKKFRWLMNEDVMASDLLATGIRKFTADTLKLEQLVRSYFIP